MIIHCQVPTNLLSWDCLTGEQECSREGSHRCQKSQEVGLCFARSVFLLRRPKAAIHLSALTLREFLGTESCSQLCAQERKKRCWSQNLASCFSLLCYPLPSWAVLKLWTSGNNVKQVITFHKYVPLHVKGNVFSFLYFLSKLWRLYKTIAIHISSMLTQYTEVVESLLQKCFSVSNLWLRKFSVGEKLSASFRNFYVYLSKSRMLETGILVIASLLKGSIPFWNALIGFYGSCWPHVPVQLWCRCCAHHTWNHRFVKITSNGSPSPSLCPKTFINVFIYLYPFLTCIYQSVSKNLQQWKLQTFFSCICQYLFNYGYWRFFPLMLFVMWPSGFSSKY